MPIRSRYLRTLVLLFTITALFQNSFCNVIGNDDSKSSFVLTPKSTVETYTDVEAVGSDGEMFVFTGTLSSVAGWAAYDRKTILEFLRQDPQSHLKAIKKWIKINDPGREDMINVAMRENGLRGTITTKNVSKVLEVIDVNLSSGWVFYSLPMQLVEYVVSLPNHPEPDHVGLGKPQDGWYDTEHGLTVIADGVVYANGVATDADTRCENNGLLIKRPMSSRPGYIGKQEVLSFLTDECANNAVVRATNNKIIIVKPGYSETEIESIIVPKLSGSATVIDATNHEGWQHGSSTFVFFDSGKYWYYDMDSPDKLHELPFVNDVKFTIRQVAMGESREEWVSDYLTSQRDDVVTVYKLSTNVTKSFKGWRYAGYLAADETIDSDVEVETQSFSFTDKLYNPRNGQYYDVDELFK